MRWNNGRNYVGQFKKNLFHGYSGYNITYNFAMLRLENTLTMQYQLYKLL